MHTHRITGKFGEFGKTSLIHQTKTMQISTYNYNLWLNLFDFLPCLTKVRMVLL